MPTKRDFFADNGLRRSQDVIALHRRTDLEPLSKIRLAAAGYADELLKGAARELYLRLAHQRSGESDLSRQLGSIRRDLGEPLFPEAFSWSDTAALEKLRLPAFIIEFYLKLATPLLTRDESGHYPIDNPARKDTALQLPVLASTSWKGLLRAAYLQCRLYPVWREWKTDAGKKSKYLRTRWQMLRLFGTEKEPQKDQPLADMLQPKEAGFDEFLKSRFRKADEKEKETVVPHVAGALDTFPTFFSALDVEVINPHDSVRRVGTNPIHLEAVPVGSIGLFRLLYLQRPALLLPDETPDHAAAVDLQAVAETLSLLFLEFGFSSKRTAGYGQAEETFPAVNRKQGRIVQNFLQPAQPNGLRPLREHAVSNFKEMVEFNGQVGK
jgi:CRISPR-associated protein Cmr2